MSKDFREALRESKSFFCPPTERLPSANSPKSSCFGIHLSHMRATWPAQGTWVLIRSVCTDGWFALERTSVSGTLSCHLPPCLWLTIHDSQECCYHYHRGDFESCCTCNADASALPDIGAKSTKCRTCFGYPVVYLSIDVHSSGEGAIEILTVRLLVASDLSQWW